jgi:predicted hydrocarbon binding protein
MLRKMGKEKAPPSHYDLNEEAGTLNSKLLESRVVAFGSYGWASIEAELNSTFVTGGQVILHRMGYSYGKYLGLIAKRKAGKADPTSIAVDLLIKIAQDSGWGSLTLNGGALSQGVLRLVNRECIFCTHLTKGREPKCFFLAGVAAGLADEVTGANHSSREERCIAKGDNVCEVVVERTAQAAQPQQP